MKKNLGIPKIKKQIKTNQNSSLGNTQKTQKGKKTKEKDKRQKQKTETKDKTTTKQV